ATVVLPTPCVPTSATLNKSPASVNALNVTAGHGPDQPPGPWPAMILTARPAVSNWRAALLSKHDAAILDDRADASQLFHLFQRVAIHEDEVGPPARLHRAEVGLLAEPGRAVHGRRLQDRHIRDARRRVSLKLFEQALVVGAGQQQHAHAFGAGDEARHPPVTVFDDGELFDAIAPALGVRDALDGQRRVEADVVRE